MDYSFQNVRQCINTGLLWDTGFQSCRVMLRPESTLLRRLLIQDTEDVLEQSADYKITELFTEHAKWKYPLTELSRLAAELSRLAAELSSLADGVELTRWRSWAEELSWLAAELNSKYQEQLNKLAAELSRRTKFNEQRRRVELDVSRTIE